MLVCPQCRNENVEEAQFCTQCGRRLEPTVTYRRIERQVSEDDLDIPQPKRASPVFGIVALITLLLAGAGVGAWALLRPDPCDGKHSSTQFPYCMAIPTGWEEGTEQIGEQEADTYSPPAGDAFILVVAEQVQPGTDTARYAQSHRQREEAGGLFPGPVERTTVGEQEAITWEVTSTTESGTVVHQLQVAVVRGGTGWVITFAGNDESYARDRGLFGSVLRSWSFK